MQRFRDSLYDIDPRAANPEPLSLLPALRIPPIAITSQAALLPSDLDHQISNRHSCLKYNARFLLPAYSVSILSM